VPKYLESLSAVLGVIPRLAGRRVLPAHGEDVRLGADEGRRPRVPVPVARALVQAKEVPEPTILGTQRLYLGEKVLGRLGRRHSADCRARRS
jgi:hypothetical protein